MEQQLIDLEDFGDNNDVVSVGDRPGRVGDITAPRTRREVVTKRQAREMFIRFVQNSPELRDLPREEQIRQFNLARRDAGRPPFDPEILVNLLVPITESR